MPSDEARHAVARAAIASRYDDVAEALRQRPARFSLDPTEIDEALRLVDRCRRLSDDRQRLLHVTDDLEDDERIARDQLVGLLDDQSSGEIVRRLTPTPAGPDTIGPTTSADDPDGRTATPRLAIWVLGGFRLAVGEQVVVGGPDDRSTPVLRYLACCQGAGAHKEQLADRFWPDAMPRAARRNVHQSIYTIRQLLGSHGAEAELVFANDHYRLGRSQVWRDIDELAWHVEQGRRLRGTGDDQLALRHFREADLLYTGELLADHPYDEWAYSMREHHRVLHREAAAALLDLHGAASDHLSIIHLARRLLELDPADEDACRRLMDAHITSGQHHLAALAFTNLVDYLRDNHGLEPSPETVLAAAPLTDHSRLQ